jgi:transposase InsO family protein
VAGFIAAQGADHGVPHATACRALSVSQAWFYKWSHGDPSPQHARREQLKIEIARLFAKHRGTYGSPRITADLRDEGWSVSENTVAALMREMNLRQSPETVEAWDLWIGAAGPLPTAAMGASPGARGQGWPEATRRARP